MDLYGKMGEQLRALFKDLFDPRSAREVLHKMKHILELARQIGGSIKDEAEQLNGDIVKFLAEPADPKRLATVKKHAMRLEQETKEL
jgi:hypothetical protein